MARQGVFLAMIVFILDQLSKWVMMVLVDIDARPPIEVTSFFKLVMVWNRGVSFGMLSDGAPAQALFLILVSLLIVTCLVAWLSRSPAKWTCVGLGLVIGGALSNVADRLLHGAVADFFYFHLGPWYWPAFNIADAGICIGVALLCLDSMLTREN